MDASGRRGQGKRGSKFHGQQPIDEYLASQNLWRKLIAKDGSCLFRAVAECVSSAVMLCMFS